VVLERGQVVQRVPTASHEHTPPPWRFHVLRGFPQFVGNLYALGCPRTRQKGSGGVEIPWVYVAPVAGFVTEPKNILDLPPLWEPLVQFVEQLSAPVEEHRFRVDVRHPLERDGATPAPGRTAPDFAVVCGLPEGFGQILQQVVQQSLRMELDAPLLPIPEHRPALKRVTDEHLLTPSALDHPSTKPIHVYVIVDHPVQVPAPLLRPLPEEKVVVAVSPQPIEQRLAPAHRYLVVRARLIRESARPEIDVVMSSAVVKE